MNRRTAIQSFIAGMCAPLAWVKGAKATPTTAHGECTITIPIRCDTSQFREDCRFAEYTCIRAGLNVPEPSGVLGETYFKIGAKPSAGTARVRCYFNGEDVHCRTCEADEIGGWAVMMDVDGDGKNILRSHRLHYGRVEFRPI